MLNTVHLQTVRFQRTSLCETLFAQIAFVGSYTGVGACMPFQIEGIVEAFAAEGAQVAFNFRVAFHVTV